MGFCPISQFPPCWLLKYVVALVEEGWLRHIRKCREATEAARPAKRFGRTSIEASPYRARASRLPSSARRGILTPRLFRLLTDIPKSFVVAFNFVHRCANPLGYPSKQPFPSKISASVIRHSFEGLFAAHICGRVVLRVVQRHLKFDRVIGGSRVSFLDTCVKALRKPRII